MPRDKSLSFRLPQAASKIVIAQPEIAKVTATTDSSFYVQGIEFGSTNLLVYGPGGRLQEVIDIRVGYDSDGLQQDFQAAFPGETLKVRNLGEVLMLAGEVSTTGVQAGAERIAEKYAPESVISRITVRASQQVMLEVRILEASRNALQDMGVNLNVANGSFSVLSGSGLFGVTPPAGVLTTHGGSARPASTPRSRRSRRRASSAPWRSRTWSPFPARRPASWPAASSRSRCRPATASPSSSGPTA